jgi:hypothetical protein
LTRFQRCPCSRAVWTSPRSQSPHSPHTPPRRCGVARATGRRALEPAIRGLEEEMADKESPNHPWTVVDTPEGELYLETPPKGTLGPTSRKVFFSFTAATTRQKTRLPCSCAQLILSQSFSICGRMAADTYLQVQRRVGGGGLRGRPDDAG